MDFIYFAGLNWRAIFWSTFLSDIQPQQTAAAFTLFTPQLHVKAFAWWQLAWRRWWCVCVGESLKASVILISSTNRTKWRHSGWAQTVILRCRGADVTFDKCVCFAALSYLQDKASRIERIVGEHQLFSQGLKELQDWVCEAQRVISTCTSSTTNKSVLEDRMVQLEVRQDGWLSERGRGKYLSNRNVSPSDSFYLWF